MSIKHVPLTEHPGDGRCLPRWVPKKVTSKKASHQCSSQRLAYVSGYLGLWLCSNPHHLGKGTLSAQAGLPWWCRLSLAPSPPWDF